jgi:hypothetical protein
MVISQVSGVEAWLPSSSRPRPSQTAASRWWMLRTVLFPEDTLTEVLYNLSDDMKAMRYWSRRVIILRGKKVYSKFHSAQIFTTETKKGN